VATGERLIETPLEFFEQILEPDYSDFSANPTSLRLAFHTAISLFHLRDWVARAQSRSKSALQKDLHNRCSSFAIIADVANAVKHLKLYQGESYSNVRGVDDVHLGRIITTAYGVAGGYGYGAYGLVPSIIVVPEEVMFAKVAAEVYEMWKNLKEKGFF
jgi:hypothetical protein